MIKAVFDAATLADAVQKAARLAPTKGSAFDKAQGILIEVDPTAMTAIIKSTNIDVSYHQRLILSDGKGDPARWRIPSGTLAGLVTNLPMGAGAVVNFFDRGDGAIRITSGRVAVKLNLLNADEFPAVTAFSTDNMSEANDFAQKVSQVAWATAKDNSIISGIHITGTHLVATDRNAAAFLPCIVPIDEPVTVPIPILAPILKAATDVNLKVYDDRLLIMLDAESQSKCAIIEGAFPPVTNLLRDDYTGKITLPKTAFVEAINRLLVVGRSDRMPVVVVTITPGLIPTMVLDLEASDSGRIQDTIDIGGEVEDEFKLGLTPGYIVPAIEASKSESVTFQYGNADPKKSPNVPIRITDDFGYEAIVAPRRLTS